jgi:hypothetical protein
MATLDRLKASCAVVVWLATVAPSAAQAPNQALLRLLQVLRDRGSITAQEYDEIRLVAAGTGEPVRPPAAAPPPIPVAGAAATPVAAADIPPIINKALASKWYERIGLRGYTQFRYTDVRSAEGPALEVPADRSVNENESFMIRRGRFIFSGDATEHVSLYAQMDFNGSTGAADFSLQMRDLYADVWLDEAKLWRVRLGQSKVPYGWVNLQSSQNRAPFERPDALNSAVEGERDLGAAVMWNSAAAKQRFRDLTGLGLKGSGDYGVVSFGAYSGQGLNRPDQNGDVHLFGRVSYPFKLANGQYMELGVQGYHGRFVVPTQAIAIGGTSMTPVQDDDGLVDERVAFTAIWYPQPIGVEAEWTVGSGPALSENLRQIESDFLQGGYLQVNYRTRNTVGSWFPFTRWNYYDGARKFAKNAPRSHVNEVDLGLEFARWTELELTATFTHTFARTRTGSFPYVQTRGANRLGFQAQWNY